MNQTAKCAVDGAVSLWGFTFCYTIHDMNEMAQLGVGLLTILVLLCRLWSGIKDGINGFRD